MLLIVLAAVLWGTTSTAQALAPAGGSPATVGAMRLAVGAAALLLGLLLLAARPTPAKLRGK